jgi:hypothetical protein
VAQAMNILVVSAYHHPAQVYGGPVPALRHLNQALALSGHRVTTYTTDANGPGDLRVPCGQPVMVDGLPVTYFRRWWFGREQKPRNLFFSPAMGRQLRRFLRPGADGGQSSAESRHSLYLLHPRQLRTMGLKR